MTMNETDKVKMTINIGGEHISLSVDFNRQDAVRDAEKAADDLFDKWRLRWPTRTNQAILAMVAYQFAYFYQDLLERYEKASTAAEESLSLIDSYLSEKAARPAKDAD